MVYAADSSSPRRSVVRALMRVVLALFYAAAGWLHLAATAKFLPIVPDWVPYPYQTVVATGICELLGAAALFVPRLRKLAGWCLAAYAVCVFPANVKQALGHIHVEGLPDSWWYHGPRLVAQPLIVWWALFASGAVDWPARAQPERRRK